MKRVVRVDIKCVDVKGSNIIVGLGTFSVAQRFRPTYFDASYPSSIDNSLPIFPKDAVKVKVKNKED